MDSKDTEDKFCLKKLNKLKATKVVADDRKKSDPCLKSKMKKKKKI